MAEHQSDHGGQAHKTGTWHWIRPIGDLRDVYKKITAAVGDQRWRNPWIATAATMIGPYEKKDQKTDDPKSPLEPPPPSALASTQEELDPS